MLFGPPPRIEPRERGPTRVGDLMPSVLARYGIGKMATKAATKVPAPKPSKDDLAKLIELSTKRKDLNRQADALEKQEAPLKAKIAAYVEENGGELKACTICGFLARLVSKVGSIAWKQEFIRVNGPEAAAEIKALVGQSLEVVQIK